jgi:hypothetical protein
MFAVKGDLGRNDQSDFHEYSAIHKLPPRLSFISRSKNLVNFKNLVKKTEFELWEHTMHFLVAVKLDQGFLS